MSLIGNYTYPARIWEDEDGKFQIRFDALPEVVEAADNLENAKALAKDCLGDAVANRIQKGLALPEPSSSSE